MKVIDLIRSRIEASEPQDTILAYLRTIDGKKINRRHVDKLRELTGDDELRLSRRFGMTSIQWGGYGRTGGTQGGDMLLAHSDKNVVVDVERILEHNQAYFGAKDKRNEKRQQALSQPEKCADLDTAIAEFQAAEAKLKALLDDDLFQPDNHCIQKHIVEGVPLDD